MVAHRVAERDSRTLHHFVVPAVKRMVVRHDVAAADAVERHAAVTADRSGDVVGRRREFRKLLRRPYLRIGDGDEPVTRIVARTAEQRKIAGFAVGRQRVEIAHHALFHRSVVARRHANEDEAVVGTGLQSVISSLSVHANSSPSETQTPSTPRPPQRTRPLTVTLPAAHAQAHHNDNRIVSKYLFIVPYFSSICIVRESASIGTARAAHGNIPSISRP